MTLLPDFMQLTSVPTVAVVYGGIFSAEPKELAPRLTQHVRAVGAKPKSRPHFAAFDAGEGLTAIGYVTARAPLAFVDRVRVRHWPLSVASATIDDADIEVEDRDASTVVDLVAAFRESGVTCARVASIATAPPEDPEIHEPDLYLVGRGVLVWGRLLANDGADYAKDRVQTFRAIIDGEACASRVRSSPRPLSAIRCGSAPTPGAR